MNQKESAPTTADEGTKTTDTDITTQAPQPTRGPPRVGDIAL